MDTTSPKYEFTGETRIWLGVELKRIRAVRAFGLIAAGALGGWIASDACLSHDGNAWIDLIRATGSPGRLLVAWPRSAGPPASHTALAILPGAHIK